MFTVHTPLSASNPMSAPANKCDRVSNHWSSTKFSSTWYDTLSVLVAKGRAKVSVAASEADWSKRIREMQSADYEDHTVGS